MGSVRKHVMIPVLFSLALGFIDSGVSASSAQVRVAQQASQAANWGTTAAGRQQQVNQDFTYRCPPNGGLTGVWGTDTYTYDSSICTAAVHAGLITTSSGGAVTIRIRSGSPYYVGTSRNGVTTAGYGSYNASFIFVNRVGGSPVTDLSIQTINWGTNASVYLGRLEQDFSYRCLPNGGLSGVWGTDIYTYDSSICTAAVHAGLTNTSNGGVVTIRVRAGSPYYVGTSRNGVTTAGYGSYNGSFVFINKIGGSPVTDLSIQTINWGTNASVYLGRLDQNFSYRCLPNGSPTGVWGTDIYTYDSSICTAAVHAGLITTNNGGVVTIRIRPGASAYAGTSRNGVTTAGYGSYTGSFIFVAR